MASHCASPAHDQFLAPMSDHSPTYQPPPDEGLDIRYIDEDLLVVAAPEALSKEED